jgi:hypothetical protein
MEHDTVSQAGWEAHQAALLLLDPRSGKFSGRALLCSHHLHGTQAASFEPTGNVHTFRGRERVVMMAMKLMHKQ